MFDIIIQYLPHAVKRADNIFPESSGDRPFWPVPRKFFVCLHVQISAKHLKSIVHAVDVAALVAVAGVDACADQAVTDIKA
jgi:hypothetical protein